MKAIKWFVKNFIYLFVFLVIILLLSGPFMEGIQQGLSK